MRPRGRGYQYGLWLPGCTSGLTPDLFILMSRIPPPCVQTPGAAHWGPGQSVILYRSTTGIQIGG